MNTKTAVSDDSSFNVAQEDLFNKLPNDLLVPIIARIPTKTAVSTSILSKRWRNLYKSLPRIKLNFMDLLPRSVHPHCSDSDLELMIHRLDSFLRLRSGSRIDDFFLAAGLMKPNDVRFEQLICYLGESSVEKLEFRFHCCCMCPKINFSCDLVSQIPDLKYLGLGLCCPLLPKPESKWNSLTTLSLIMCTVVPGFLDCILSNCLNLGSLIVNGCDCPPKLRIRGPSLRLKTLRVENCGSIEEIELHASNLYEFEYRSSKKCNLVFDYVPQLEILIFITASGYRNRGFNMIPYVFGEIAKNVSGLKCLSFDASLDFKQLEGTWMGRSRFGQLRVLEMTVAYTTPPSNLLELIPCLESCPELEELQLNLPEVFGEVVGAVTVGDEVIEMWKLKKVEINGFRGTKNEMELALHILKAAFSLQQMCIIRSPKQCTRQWPNATTDPWTEETLQNIKRRLLGQALSPNAKLIIQHQS